MTTLLLRNFLRTSGSCVFPKRSLNFSGRSSRFSFKDQTYMYYTLAGGIGMLGVGYAGVPLYRLYCSKTGTGTDSRLAKAKTELIEKMKPVKGREITVYFSAGTHSQMSWKFRPVQTQLKVVPGETALAFFAAENPTDRPIVGIATYSVVPPEAAKYFNKIQCFCFEEQRLNPHEKVDMPVFFFLDPELADDPLLERVNRIVLHYTFFEAKDSRMSIPGITNPASPSVATA